MKVRSLFRALFLFLLFFKTASFAQNADLMVVDFEYDDPSKSFKMQVPADWDVKKGHLGYALFMEPKVKEMASPAKPLVTDPNISVAVFSTPQFIDERTLEEYEKDLASKFKETNGDIPFQVFSKNLVDLPGGNKGLLYYVSYNNNGLDIVSAILVMSSSTLSYRVTFTDEKVGFEKQFEKYFPVLASIQIHGPAPARAGFLESSWPIILTILIFGMIAAAIYMVRKKQQNALISEVTGDSTDSAGSKPPVDEDSIYKDPDGSYKSVNEGYSVISETDEIDDYEEPVHYDQDSNPFSKPPTSDIPSSGAPQSSQPRSSKPMSSKPQESSSPQSNPFQSSVSKKD